MAYIEGEDRCQKTLFPEAIEDYITSDNPVRVIEAFVNSLDISELGFDRGEPNDVGRPSYDPRDLLKLYLYGYMNGIRSSRKLEAEANRNIELFWLLGKLKPDFKTIADFRKDNKEPIKAVFKQFSLLCKEWELYGQEVVAVDGSKFRANNSKRNNFNKKKVKRHKKYLEEKIAAYINELDNNDDQEEDIRTPNEEEIKERIEELENRKEKYNSIQQEMDETGTNEISTTDPDACLMSTSNNGIEVSYNVQTTVDDKHNLIVDSEVINNPADQGHLSGMAKQAKDMFGEEKLKALADKGYYSSKDLKECEENNIETYVAKQKHTGGTVNTDFQPDKFQYDKENDTYICPAGQILYPSKIRNEKGVRYRVYKNFRACQKCEFKEQCTKSNKGRTIHRNLDQSLLDKVDKRTQENRTLYQKRQMIVEHPFGTIKKAWGFGSFLTRRLPSVRTENKLHFLVYNIKRSINILGVEEIVKRLATV